MGEQIKILLADDHRVLRQGMAQALETQPDMVVVAQANNGIEAVELVKTHQPDVALVDINMPEMNGITCIEKILDDDPNANLSIFSGYEEEGIENMSQRAKDAIKDYLAKPVGLEALSALLAKMLKEK